MNIFEIPDTFQHVFNHHFEIDNNMYLFELNKITWHFRHEILCDAPIFVQTTNMASRINLYPCFTNFITTFETNKILPDHMTSWWCIMSKNPKEFDCKMFSQLRELTLILRSNMVNSIFNLISTNQFPNLTHLTIRQDVMTKSYDYIHVPSQITHFDSDWVATFVIPAGNYTSYQIIST